MKFGEFSPRYIPLSYNHCLKCEKIIKFLEEREDREAILSQIYNISYSVETLRADFSSKFRYFDETPKLWLPSLDWSEGHYLYLPSVDSYIHFPRLGKPFYENTTMAVLQEKFVKERGNEGHRPWLTTHLRDLKANGYVTIEQDEKDHRKKKIHLNYEKVFERMIDDDPAFFWKIFDWECSYHILLILKRFVKCKNCRRNSNFEVKGIRVNSNKPLFAPNGLRVVLGVSYPAVWTALDENLISITCTNCGTVYKP